MKVGGRWNQQGRKHVIRGRVERQSTGLSSHNIKEVPGENVAEESLVRGGLWGRPEYITVISGTVPQTHGAEKVVQSERGWGEGHTQNTTDSAQLQSVLAVAAFDAGGFGSERDCMHVF